MQILKLITYTFDPNVGPFDRVFRVLSGLALAVFPWLGLLALPAWLAPVLTAFGIAWAITGIVSRCGLYYFLGFTTRRET